MPIPLIPSGSSYPTSFVAPDDGDFVDGASIQQTAQPILDAAQFAKNATDTLTANIPWLTQSGYLYRAFPAWPMLPTAIEANYNWLRNTTDGDGPSVYVEFANTSSGVIPFSLPVGWHKGLLGHVYVRLRGSPGNHSALPVNMPYAKLVRDKSNGECLDLGVQTVDSSASVAAYEAWHFIHIDMSGIPDSLHTGPDPHHYVLWVGNEFGTNSIPGLQIGTIYVGIKGE